MRIDYIPEPELEFGNGGRHIDIRFGLMDHGPLDLDRTAHRQIEVGLVGTHETTERLAEWLLGCQNGIAAKDSVQPNLFPRFPGFMPEGPFRSRLIFADRYTRNIPEREFDQLSSTGSPNHVIAGSTKLFVEEFRILAENPEIKLVICAPPMHLVHAWERTKNSTEQDGETKPLNFRRLLKARAMDAIDRPVQIVLPMTYDESKRLPQKRRSELDRRMQDEATRAWNLHSALYYKAGGTPWRLMRESTKRTTCYVGVSFFRTLNEESMHTSMAQVFNELGEGIIIRGAAVERSKKDKQHHLKGNDAKDLLDTALNRYRKEHDTAPARVVLHKTTNFNDEEEAGFAGAVDDHRIAQLDLLSFRRSYTRLFRMERYPPLRGTFLNTNEENILYTRGSVDFYETYPGQYVPRPLAFQLARAESTPRSLAAEVLALSKMNWNTTQFDNGSPITIKAAKSVGDILKYLREGDRMSPQYRFYM